MAPHQNTKSCGLKTAWPINIGFDSTPTNMKGNYITRKIYHSAINAIIYNITFNMQLHIIVYTTNKFRT